MPPLFPASHSPARPEAKRWTPAALIPLTNSTHTQTYKHVQTNAALIPRPKAKTRKHANQRARTRAHMTQTHTRKHKHTNARKQASKCTNTQTYRHAHTHTHTQSTDRHTTKNNKHASTTHKHTSTQKHKHAHTHTHTQTHKHANTQTHKHANTQTHKHTNTQTHKHTNTQTHKHTNTQTRKQTHTHTNTQTHINTNTQTHKHTNKQTHTHLSRVASLADKTARNPWLPLASTTKEADSDFWGPNITKTKGPTAGTFSRDQRGVFVGHRPPGSPVAPRRVFIVRDPGRHTHTKPRWGGHEPHRGNSTRGPPKTPRQQQKIFNYEKPGAQNQAEGIPPGDLQKPAATAKDFQGRKTRAHKKTTQREFHQGTAKNPAATAKDFQRRKNRSTHQGIA